MERDLLRAFYAVVTLSAAMEFFTFANALNSVCPAGFVNMGDSLTDTGNALDVFPFFADAENPPYGETFFGKPAKRFCNGRLVPDFFSLAFKTPVLLQPYSVPAAFNYRNGVNFAVAGATASLVPTAITPISLSFQVGQFIRFQNSAAATSANIACVNFALVLPNPILSPYSKWLYTLEFGGNDILSSLTSGVSPSVIASNVIPDAVRNISAAVEILYTRSARNFLIFGIPAQGCSTIVITLFGNGSVPLDSLGCVDFVNQLVEVFNSALLQAIVGLRTNLTDATIAYFDYYSANLEILQNPQNHGFDPSKIKVACCGAPGVGNLNYNPSITCGRPGSNVCAEPFKYVNWDGVHFTDHFYSVIAKFALNAQFTDHGTNYTALCPLDFSKFSPTATYNEVFGLQCDNQFA